MTVIKSMKLLAIPALGTGLALALASKASAASAATPDAVDLADHQPGHPRLLADDADFARLRRLIDGSPRHAALFSIVRARAEGLLGSEPVTYRKEGRRLLAVSREVLARTTALGITAKVTGDARFRDRLLEELRTVCRFSDWNPSHFLDTAEMCLAVAIGYDWFFNEMPSTDRGLLATGIRDLGLKPSFEGPHSWITTDTNWNQVCHGGLSAGALALFDEEPDLAQRTLRRALDNIPRAMDPYQPDGVYPEGPGYWAYGTSFNVVFLALLEHAYGHTFGLLEGSALAKSPAYVAHMTGPTGEVFNYSDNSARPGVGVGVLWLASRTAQPSIAAMEEENSRRILQQERASLGRLVPLRLLWMGDEAPRAGDPLPLSFHGRGENPVAVHRTSWTDPDALFIAVKAGSPYVNHGHMDTGSFVMEAMGVRWAFDLGVEHYHGIESRGMNLWDRTQGGDRWTVFRLNNLSHSTLVIGGRHQVVQGSAPITAFSDDPDERSTTVDLTPVYAGQASRVIRRIALVNRDHVIIEDSLEGVEAGEEIRWAMVTHADMKPAVGGWVRLEQNSRMLDLRATLRGAEGGIRWEEYSLAPPNEWDSPNPNARMVGFRIRSGGMPIHLVVRAAPVR